MKNYYAILEVPVGCSLEEIRQAYRRLAQENLDNEAVFTDLKEAHEVLTTPTRRAEYDLAAWGETFSPTSLGGVDAPLPLDDESLVTAAHASRCPMGSEAQCPVLQARVASADKFCPDCGFLLAALSVGGFQPPDPAETDHQMRLEEPDGQTHRLQPGPNLIGRESADVLLPDKTVSRQHARLEVGEEGVVMLEDLGSTNGTQVNGELLEPHVTRRVVDGDRLRFGSIQTQFRLPPPVPIRAELPPPGEAAPSAPETDPGSPPRAKVVEMREEDAREFLLVPGVTTFGRRAENSVVLQGDPYVSGNHAQIIADEETFRLTDVGSTNGTLLNGERLAINAPVMLSDGDVILIGGTAVRFEMLAPVAEPETAETETAETETASDAPAEPIERIAPEYDAPEPAEAAAEAPDEDSSASPHAETHAEG